MGTVYIYIFIALIDKTREFRIFGKNTKQEERPSLRNLNITFYIYYVPADNYKLLEFSVAV